MNMKKIESKLADQIKEKLFGLLQKSIADQELSQGEVASRMGIERTNLNRVLNGKNGVSLEFLLKMAEHMSLDVELKVRPKK